MRTPNPELEEIENQIESLRTKQAFIKEQIDEAKRELENLQQELEEANSEELRLWDRKFEIHDGGKYDEQ